MEPSYLRKLLAASAFFLLFFGLSASFAHTDRELDEAAIIERIKKMKSEVVPPRYDNVVRSYLRTYLIYKRQKAEDILGKSIMYFPLFEQKLEEHNMPEDLKYLAVVESALDPNAVSRARAVGLWQFMAPTGKAYGLKINYTVDERRDPVKSTEAAIRYLNDLYERFGDWSLALAAYNSGSGRVSRAIKRARSKDYWRIRRYLPRETRNYVPAFIAATYLLQHYEAHELTPNYPPLDMQITETIKVYDEFQLAELAQLSELPIELVEALNPAYVKGIIPANERGNYITLPKRLMTAFQQYVESRRPDTRYNPIASTPIYVSRANKDVSSNYIKSIYIVRDGETIEKIAKAMQCSVHQLKAWNKLKTTELSSGQQLTVYHPKELKRFREDDLRSIASLPMPELSLLPKPASAAENLTSDQAFLLDRYLHYTVRRRERLSEIAECFPEVTVEQLEHLNRINGKKMLKPGDLVKIRRL